MTYEQFISKLEKAGIEYTLFHFDAATYVEVGPYGYRFINGQSKGGWNRNCGEDWRTEWEMWAAMLREPNLLHLL